MVEQVKQQRVLQEAHYHKEKRKNDEKGVVITPFSIICDSNNRSTYSKKYY